MPASDTGTQAKKQKTTSELAAAGTLLIQVPQQALLILVLQQAQDILRA